MRDPAVHAIYALHMTPSEVATVREGCPVYRPYWPPVCCRDSVVGLSAGGEVTGEAHLLSTAHTPDGVGASSLPEAPMGTLTVARDWETYE